MRSHSAMSSGPRPQRDWTVLFYGAGVNNLDSNIKETWESVEGTKLPENVDTYIRHFDQSGEMSDYTLGSSGHAEMLSETKQDVNSADPEVLADFIQAGMAKYPAKHYLVVLSSHGQGAQGVIEDDKTSDLMSPRQLESALTAAKASNQGRPLDAVLFDACQMASLEMASQLVGVAGVAIGSMDNIGNAGYNLQEILKSASEAPDGKTLGKDLVENNKTQQLESCNSLSAIELDKLGPLQSAVGDLAKSLKSLPPADISRVRDIVQNCRRNVASPLALLGSDYMADDILEDHVLDQQMMKLWLKNEEPGQSVSLIAFVEDLVADQDLCHSHPELKEAAENVQESHEKAVFAHRAHDRNKEVGGLSLRFPLKNEPGSLYSNSEQELDFSKATEWESAYDVIVPEGQHIPRRQTWLEAELGLEVPDQAS